METPEEKPKKKATRKKIEEIGLGQVQLRFSPILYKNEAFMAHKAEKKYKIGKTNIAVGDYLTRTIENELGVITQAEFDTYGGRVLVSGPAEMHMV